MVGYWLTVVFFMIMIVFCVILFIQAIKSAVNTEDAYTIDPLPKPIEDEKE